MSQVFYSLLHNFALGHFCVEFVLPESFQNLSKMCDVVSLGLAVYQNIVKIDNYKFIKKFVKNIVHQSHECCRGIGQSKRHYYIFKVAVSGSKCCLGNVFFLDSNLVVTREQV